MSCRGCIYRAPKGSAHQCDYLYHTGHSRGCPIEGCTKRETKKRPSRRPRPVNLPGSLPPDRAGNWTPHRTMEDRPGPPRKLNEAAALELYHKGLTDQQIADELGNMKKRGIAAWRKRRGLPCQSERKEHDRGLEQICP